MKKIIVLLLTITLILSIGCLKEKEKNPPYIEAIVEGEEGNEGWYISNVTIFLNATDNESEVKELKYRINGGMWIKYVMPIKLQKDGIYFIEFYAKDGNGNERQKNMTLKIDKTSPFIEFSNFEPGYIYFRGKKYITPRIPRDTMIIGRYVIRVNALDGLSGLKKVEFYLGDSLAFEDEKEPFEWEIGKTIGVYNITAVAYDYAGNYNEISVEEVQFIVLS